MENDMLDRLAERLRALPCRDMSAGPDAAELDLLRRREAVRALLSELREPTEAMEYAAVDGEVISTFTARCVWYQMIDAALSPPFATALQPMHSDPAPASAP